MKSGLQSSQSEEIVLSLSKRGMFWLYVLDRKLLMDFSEGGDIETFSEVSALPKLLLVAIEHTVLAMVLLLPLLGGRVFFLARKDTL